MNRASAKNRIVLFVISTAAVVALLYLLFKFQTPTLNYLQSHMAAKAKPQPETIVYILYLFLWATLAYLIVRALRSLLFGLIFRLKRGYEAPTLARNIFSIVVFAICFLAIFSQLFPDISLGGLVTTSAIFGVILGLALQDTLGNFFAGISLHADRPFQVGDVVSIGHERYTGVVEGITWRAIKIRTFQNHLVLLSNSSVAKEAIEVCPRNNLNARLVYFSSLYTDSPAKAIHMVREAIHEAENVSKKITPIVRIRNLGESGVEYEIKYWLEDYARYNDTDALLRQRIWYAFRRAGLTFNYPTRTVRFERRPTAATAESDHGALIERLSAVDIFAPLTVDEIVSLARAAVRHVFAHDEMVIRAGDSGSSMFVVHHGRVQVEVNDGGRFRPLAVLNQGDFFGEMALFTGEPRTANVVALEETEVLEIGHEAMKELFETNPDLVESLSHVIAERRRGLADCPEGSPLPDESAGILHSIKRFFGLR